jgi:hypothetical protein
MVTAEMMTGWMNEAVVSLFAAVDEMTEDDYIMTRLVSFMVCEV